MPDKSGIDYVTHQVRETGVQLIRLWFVDMAGHLKEVAITDEQLETVLMEGLGIDGGVMRGPETDESELILTPDLSTFAVLPTLEGEREIGRMLCDVRLPTGEPAPGDARGLLKGAVAAAAAQGHTFYVGCEIEHFVFHAGPLPLEPTDRGGRYDPGIDDGMVDLKRETLQSLEQLGVAVDSFHHEDAPGQYKVGLQYGDALTMADGLLTYRQIVRQTASRHGYLASFMPKPLTDEEGSGLHFSLSLAREGQNAFFDEAGPHGLSAMALAFLAGLLDHAAAATLITNPTVNSYKRLLPGFSAPVAATWAPTGRGDLVRVPPIQAGHETRSTRLEYRAADPSCNPYLALTVLLAAGLDGIDRELAPPPFRPPDTRPIDAGPPLPRHLPAAVAAARESALLAGALGEPLLAQLATTADREWRRYHAQVTRWEQERYLL